MLSLLDRTGRNRNRSIFLTRGRDNVVDGSSTLRLSFECERSAKSKRMK